MSGNEPKTLIIIYFILRFFGLNTEFASFTDLPLFNRMRFETSLAKNFPVNFREISG